VAFEEFLTVGEIADLLRLNQQTIRNYIDRGELPAVRLGTRRVRVRRADLEAFIEASSTATVDAAATDDSAVRAELELALERTRAALDGTDTAVLVGSLRELSTAARRLVRLHEVRGPSRATRAEVQSGS
jgi:excisionase family DNA binding protein